MKSAGNPEIKRLYAFALVACAAGAASAQSVSTSDTGLWRYLQSDEIIETDDWPALRDAVIAAWGGDTLAEVPVGLGNMLDRTGMPAAYRASSAAVEVVHLEGPPSDSDVLEVLTQMLPDIALQDLGEFQDGVHLTALAMPRGGSELGIFFLDWQTGAASVAAEPSAAGAGSLSDRIIAALQDGGQLADGFPPFGQGGSPFIYTTAPLDELAALVRQVLAGQGIAVTEISMGAENGTQFMGTDTQVPTMISVAKADEDVTFVTIVAQP